MQISPRGHRLITISIIFTCLTTATMVLRFWAIRIQRRNTRLDDVFVVIAFASLIALEGTVWWGVQNNLGGETTDLTLQEAAVQQRLTFASFFTWTFGTVCCKISILLLYINIFPRRPFQLIAYGNIGLNVAYAVAFIPVFVTHCIPPQKAWNPTLPGHCRPFQFQEYASVSINMLLDLLVVVLPLPVIWGLQMPRKKKIGVSLVFSLGLAVIAVMIWRIQFTAISISNANWNYSLYITAIQTLLEVWLGIIAANLPTLPPLASRFPISTLRSYFSTTHLPFTGHSGSTSLRKKSFKQLDEESGVELNAQRNVSYVSKANSSSPSHERYSRRHGEIEMRRDIEIFHGPREGAYGFTWELGL